MLPKISRYLLVALGVVTLAYILPSVYHTLFDTRINPVNITYSELKKDYLVMQVIDGKPAFIDRKKKVYNQQEFMEATPITNYWYHLSKGTMPDSFAGVKLIPQVLQRESFWGYNQPEILYAPVYGLYPLFESRPEFGLRYPTDMFRINTRMEFIDAKTNTINEAKTKLFTDHINKEGFAYPAKIIAGLPTLMKRKDEGWFIVDAKEQLFHIVMVKGEPYVKKIQNPGGIRFKHIICNDYDSGEFFATIISADNKVYVLNKADYSTTQFPIEGYDPEHQVMMFTGNQFNKTITLMDEKGSKVVTVDRQYKVIGQITELLPLKSEMVIGKVFNFIFPFHLTLDSPDSSFITMSAERSATYGWIILNLVLLVLTIIFIRREGKAMKNSILDLIIVAVTGIFGFLAVHIVPNKQY